MPKTAIITGAGSGIGKALAIKFASEGYNVSICGRDMDKLNEVKDEIEKAKGKVLAIQADVTKIEDCEKFILETVKVFGGIDVLINNAGISMRAPFEEVNVEVLEKLMDVNFWGTVYCTKQALPHIIKSKGSIVGISSIAGYRGLPARTGYSASKFAMQGFLESLRTELIPKGVHVMIACPGFTSSNIRNTALDAEGKSQRKSPLDEGKIMSAEVVADKIFNGVIKRKRTLIMTLQGRMTVFLNKWLPAWMDKMVLKHFRKEENSPLK